MRYRHETCRGWRRLRYQRPRTESPYTDSGSDWARLPQVVDEIRTLECRSIGIAAEVSKSDQVENMVRKVIGEFGYIDILVNNAGALAGPRSRHWTG